MRVLALLGVGLVVTAAACGSEATSDEAVTVAIGEDGGFRPASVDVPAGTTVVFENRGTRLRRVVGDGIDSGRIAAQDFWAMTLADPGTYTVGLDGGDASDVAVIEVRP